MRYFSTNVTVIIKINQSTDHDFMPDCEEGLKALSKLARELSNFFDVPYTTMQTEVVRAHEHGRFGDTAYYKATELTPAMASAVYSIMRVIFHCGWDLPKGISRHQAFVSDLNLGRSLLVLTCMDYEGCLIDDDIAVEIE